MSENKKTVKVVWGPIQVQLCRNRDKKRSMPYIGEKGRLVNPLGFTFCNKENKLVSPRDPCKCHLAEGVVFYEISCRKCGNPLVKYGVMPKEKGTEEGVVGFQYTQFLFAYRPREDGIIGLECSCGISDTRLPTVERIRHPANYPGFVRDSDKNEADFGKSGKYFKSKKITS